MFITGFLLMVNIITVIKDINVRNAGIALRVSNK